MRPGSEAIQGMKAEIRSLREQLHATQQLACLLAAELVNRGVVHRNWCVDNGIDLSPLNKEGGK